LPESSAQSPARASVGAHRVDESPYGLFDTVGNVNELCQDPYTRWGVGGTGALGYDPGLRIHRGGSYRTNAEYCQAGGRTTGRLEMRAGYLGFRVFRSV
jgi:formylglycine-generating enzyme required for sulfatase activity